MRLTLIVLLLCLVASLAAAQEEPVVKPDAWADFWADHPVKWAAFKSATDLTSFGVGASMRLVKLNETSGAWIDAAPYYDDASRKLTGLLGLSTEIEGIPVVAQVLRPLQALAGGKLNRAGIGMYQPPTGTPAACIYVAIDF